MAVKIIPYIFPSTVKCKKCKSVLSFNFEDIVAEQEEAGTQSDTNEPFGLVNEETTKMFFGVNCPKCGQFAVIDEIRLKDFGLLASEAKKYIQRKQQ